MPGKIYVWLFLRFFFFFFFLILYKNSRPDRFVTQKRWLNLSSNAMLKPDWIARWNYRFHLQAKKPFYIFWLIITYVLIKNLKKESIKTNQRCHERNQEPVIKTDSLQIKLAANSEASLTLCLPTQQLI